MSLASEVVCLSVHAASPLLADVCKSQSDCSPNGRECSAPQEEGRLGESESHVPASGVVFTSGCTSQAPMVGGGEVRTSTMNLGMKRRC